MTGTLMLLTLASDLAAELQRVTHKFPPEEKFVTIPQLRDEALSIMENTAYGMADFHLIHRFRFLMRAKRHLESLNSHLVLIRTTRLVNTRDLWTLEEQYGTLKIHLIAMIDALQKAILKPSDMSP